MIFTPAARAVAPFIDTSLRRLPAMIRDDLRRPFSAHGRPNFRPKQLRRPGDDLDVFDVFSRERPTFAVSEKIHERCLEMSAMSFHISSGQFRAIFGAKLARRSAGSFASSFREMSLMSFSAERLNGGRCRRRCLEDVSEMFYQFPGQFRGKTGPKLGRQLRGQFLGDVWRCLPRPAGVEQAGRRRLQTGAGSRRAGENLKAGRRSRLGSRGPFLARHKPLQLAVRAVRSHQRHRGKASVFEMRPVVPIRVRYKLVALAVVAGHFGTVMH